MSSGAGVSLLALPPSAVADRPTATLADLEATLEPDAVWVTGPAREPQAFARARRAFDVPAVHPPLETGAEGVDRFEISRERDAGSIAVAVAPGVRAMDAQPDAVATRLDDARVLLCDDVATTVRPTALETGLEGASTLASALPIGQVTTLLTGSESADYDAVWHLEADTGAVRRVDHEPIGRVDPLGGDCVSVRVRGAGPVAGYGQHRAIALLTLGAGGVVGVDTHDVTDFGLEAVTGIGPKTATRLAERGVTTREDLLETPVETLTDLPGVGPDGARTMHYHATVLETGEPVRLTDDPLPGENWSTPPLCIDIETDGLSPTIIWQIGVYDPATDDYRAFVERDDPADPGPVLEAVCDWLLGVHGDRALLTWNGWGFDYRHLGSFVSTHVPDYAEEWESIPKFDLYRWADGNDNAVLPGRTNQLEVVADALGYEDAGTGLDGAATAAAYQRFARTGEELDWERHEAYCEDDCRALWHVYERLREAPRASESAPTAGDGDPYQSGTTAASGAARTAGSDSERTGHGSSDRGESEQTGLGDFS